MPNPIIDATSALPSWGPPGSAAAAFAARVIFEHVSLRHGQVSIFEDISFELAPGEIICLLGPSGCGKTSLLQVASGIERPAAGRVTIGGRLVAGGKTFVPPERRGISLMFQDFALFPHLTILQNVMFGLKALDRASAAAQARNALRRVGMEPFATQYPGSLSGGEQQRVALARAIAPRPSVLLMDEPFSGLDQRLRESVRAETLMILKETRASCIVVTHDSTEALGMADRILLMRKGRLVQAGKPPELYDHPVDIEAARFFCDFNELECDVRAGRVETPFGTFATIELGNARRASVLIRPQGLMPSPDESSGLPGLISSVRYEGDFCHLRVLFQDIETPLLVRVPTSGAPAKGTVCRFTAKPEHVLCFAA